MRKECSVCQKPGAAEIVNELLQKRIPMSEIAATVGIGKSSIHRHSKVCWIRARAQRIRANRYDPTRRVIVSWPDFEAAPANVRGRFFVWSYPGMPEKAPLALIPRSDLRPDDQICEVVYEAPIKPFQTMTMNTEPNASTDENKPLN